MQGVFWTRDGLGEGLMAIHVLRLGRGIAGTLRTRCGRPSDKVSWVAFWASFFLLPVELQCKACRRSCLSEAPLRGLLRAGLLGKPRRRS